MGVVGFLQRVLGRGGGEEIASLDVEWIRTDLGVRRWCVAVEGLRVGGVLWPSWPP